MSEPGGQLWAAPAQAGAGGVDTPVLHRVARRADGAAVLVGTQRTRERAFAGAAPGALRGEFPKGYVFLKGGDPGPEA